MKTLFKQGYSLSWTYLDKLCFWVNSLTGSLFAGNRLYVESTNDSIKSKCNLCLEREPKATITVRWVHICKTEITIEIYMS